MKINYPKNTPLVKLPQQVEFTIFLLREELKNRKLTNDLGKIGFDSTICNSDFSDFIFSSIGLDEGSDDFYAWYLHQLDSFCKNIDLTDDLNISQEAFNFYIHLMVEKKKQEEKKASRSKRKH